MIVISVIRKGASKRLFLSVMDSSHYLSILQIFESTNDVVDYQVSEYEDKYLPNTQGFDKWKPIKQ